MTGAEALDFEAHLTECAGCRREYDDLRGTVDAVRGARPLYEVPERSYAAVAGDGRGLGAAAEAAPVGAGGGRGGGVAGGGGWRGFPPRGRAMRNSRRRRIAITPGGRFRWTSRRASRRSCRTGWSRACRFISTLPNYPEGGPKRYALAGARLMQYRGEDVAYLAYEMDRKPISLLISSSSRIAAVGRRELSIRRVDLLLLRRSRGCESSPGKIRG